MGEVLKKILNRNPPSINNKFECYHLYEKNFFGNKALTWKTLEELKKSDWKKEICIRIKQPGRGSKTRYNIKQEDIEKEISNLKKDGHDISTLTFNQSMPDEKLLIQGELCQSQRGIELRYTNLKKPMNLGLKEQNLHAHGIKALSLLKKNLNSQSFHDIMDLLQIFSDSVIEFSTYSINIGNIPGRNTVIWEVRNY